MTATPYPVKTLSISNARAWHHKLAWESRRLDESVNDGSDQFAYMFINAALTAWHMIDWVYHDLSPAGRTRFPELRDLRGYVRSQCGYLVLCREVADGSKHAILTYKPDPNIGTRKLSVTFPTPAGDTGHDLWYVETESALHDPKQVIRSSLYFWNEFLNCEMKDWGKPGTGLFAE